MEKSPDAFRTISEVSEDLDIPQHVLRFWETRFNQIRPLKRGGGRRYYRPDDVDLLRGIRHLLYGQGYTIRGVQRILKEQGVKGVQALGRGEVTAPPPSADAVDLDEFETVEMPVAMPPEHAAEAPDAAESARPSQAHAAIEHASYVALPPPAQSALALGEGPAPSAPSNRPLRAPAASGRLSADSQRRLTSALAELEECRRLLASLQDQSPAGP